MPAAATHKSTEVSIKDRGVGLCKDTFQISGAKSFYWRHDQISLKFTVSRIAILVSFYGAFFYVADNDFCNLVKTSSGCHP